MSTTIWASMPWRASSGVLSDAVGADRVVVQPDGVLEGVAERQVTDVVQEGGRARLAILRHEVGHERKESERVLEAGVGLHGRDRRGPRMGDETEAPHPPGREQLSFQVGQVHLDPPQRLDEDLGVAERAHRADRATSRSASSDSPSRRSRAS